jgi:protein-disulfide isomerase
MSSLARLAVALALVFISFAAMADEGAYPIKADDGSIVANHKVPATLEARIDKLPGVVVVGNPRGTVTLAEFYDVNCPYCRAASGDIAAILGANPDLRLVLVPFPVLGIPSIQGTLVELAVARLAPPQKFYEFHRMLMASRGTVGAPRAFAVAKAIGLDPAKVEVAANGDHSETLKAHLRIGDALGIMATPGFVIHGVAIVGYPGAKSLTKVIASVKRCGDVVCAAGR